MILLHSIGELLVYSNMCGYLGILMLLYLSGINADWHADFGPWFVPTEGEPWPSVNMRSIQNGFLILRPSTFDIKLNQDCDILTEAKTRYMSIITSESHYARLKFPRPEIRRSLRADLTFKGELEALDIRVAGACEVLPHLHMNESYRLTIIGKTADLFAPSVWGALRGLETFSQLLAFSGQGANLKIQTQTIFDTPKLPHRGLLLDTSRHFFPISDILLTLDAMSYNKLNVFHWHIIDDNSFPYQSKAFPELSEKGSWLPGLVYTADDIKHVMEYARLRGIRVMPEFDSPGHVRSWGESHPEMLTTCYDTTGVPNGRLGPLDPSKEIIWPFLRTLFNEVMDLFQDKYIHLGGDEVPFDCWASNPNVRAFMTRKGMGADFTRLESSYIAELLKIPAAKNKSSVVWQEVFDNNVDITSDTVVHVWTGLWSKELEKVTQAGHSALLSACWYLDHVAGGGDWKKYYRCDPLDFNGADVNRHLMLGGEACMWGEFVDSTNVHQRIWPRASATAERLWSQGVDTIERAARRLEEHTCRMRRRRIPAQPPNGPSVCYA
ncbi:beta-hexosaminidase subunit beta-like isoform X1 [Diachasmimorpha longicaudata]|uniref:beta-hexosaminidase subunit beta-like isoform X1 n=1 Tax=Diachasmimorpha longicaudata TaxID=58733 RepID=UPI0030B906F1